MNDSIDIVPAPVVAADTLNVLPRTFADAAKPFDATLDTALLARMPEVRAAQTAADSVAALAPPPAWQEGLEPTMRAKQPGNTTGFLLVIALMFVVMVFNFRHLTRLLGVYVEELVKVRHGRDNVFDERPAGDTRVLILLILQSVVSAGILLGAGICRLSPEPMPLTGLGVGAMIVLAGVYYLVELGAYQAVGYTFASSEGRHEWVRGFNASQALLGMGLAVPAVLAIFYPAWTEVVVWIGVILYFIARLLFIIKGFRIFYDKIGAFVYFILYLCTLEIIPLIIVFKYACLLVRFIG